MYCSKCGYEVVDGAKFCAKCGAPVAQPVTSQENSSASNEGAAYAQATQNATQAMPPVASAASQDSENASKSPSRKKLFMGIGIGAGAAAIIIAIIVGVLLLVPGSPSPLNGGKNSGGTTRGSTTVVVASNNGTKVETIQRPTLITFNNVETTFTCAPALVKYVTAGNNKTQSSSNANSDTASNLKVSNDGTLSNPYGSIADYTVEKNLSNVTNAKDFSLSNTQLVSLLEKNKFAVEGDSGYSEFFDLYEMNRYTQLASFVTTDSVMHTYHLYFSHLLKTSEKNQLSDLMLSASTSMLDASIAQQKDLAGTEWEQAVTRNVTYFAVACKLLDPSFEPPADVANTVNDEVSKITSANGQAKCAITDDAEDYSQYKPRGYYEGDTQLERYFRAMMWYGRINFAAKNDDLNRSALLMTLALDGGSGGTPNEAWAKVYTITSFFAGMSDDCGYYEYYPLIVAAYGKDVSAKSLVGNDKAWAEYKDLTSKVAAPKISSVIVGDETTVADDDIKGFRLMGQRFTIDEAIFQQLVYDNVGTESNPRLLPDTLDLPAALGSDEALTILNESGASNYANYDKQMETVRTEMANADSSTWTQSLYSQWLYTLNPLLSKKDSTYPAFMQSSEWLRKDLQTYLGSYTELKHDTVLYTKQLMVEMGGGPVNHDDRGYVEPEPAVYARLANLAQSTIDGLKSLDAISAKDVQNLTRLKELSTQLETISIKELSDKEISSDEYELIRSYGGQLEHFWDEVNPGIQDTMNKSNSSPSAVVVDIATNATDGKVLETATGKIKMIYVVVPINGELHLARGGVWSYYEFTQPLSNRLTDSQWRTMLGIPSSTNPNPKATAPAAAEWTDSFTVSK